MFLSTVVIFLMTLSPISSLIGPLTKPNGDVDLDSLTSHMTLMEQTMTSLQTQIQTTSTELTTVKADLKTTRQEFLSLQSDHNNAVKDLAVSQSQLKDALSEITTLKSDLQTAESDISELKTQVELASKQPTEAPPNFVNVTVLDVIGRDVKSNMAEIASLKSEVNMVKLEVNETRLGVEMIGDRLNSSEAEVPFMHENSSTNESSTTLLEIDNLKQSVQYLELTMNGTNFQVEKIGKHCKNSAAEVADLKGQLMSAVSDMNYTRNEIDTLNESVHDLEINLNGHNISLDHISLALEHLETDVAFQASPSAYYLDATDFSKLIYDAVYYNVGGGYNGTSGEFIAPVSGTYMFWAGTSTFGGNTKVTIRLHLNHDRHGFLAQGTGISTSNSTESTATVVTVAHLQRDDVIWLEKYSGKGLLFGTQESYIGGVLLRRNV